MLYSEQQTVKFAPQIPTAIQWSWAADTGTIQRTKHGKRNWFLYEPTLHNNT